MTLIYVFGSNLAGRHGKGSARTAYLKHGAIIGVGKGLQGNSYGIATKGYTLNVLSLEKIEQHVHEFVAFATANPSKVFQVEAIGCRNAGYTPSQIAPFFKEAPPNCYFKPEFHEVLADLGVTTKTWADLQPPSEPPAQANLF